MSQRIKLSPVAPAVLGGILISLIGGAIWGLVVIVLDRPVGFAAWVLGALSGSAALLLCRGRGGRSLQIGAVAAALSGIALGHYIPFFYHYKKMVMETFGAMAGGEVSFLSLKVAAFFVKNIWPVLADGHGLWTILAVVTAWWIPRARRSTRSER